MCNPIHSLASVGAMTWGFVASEAVVQQLAPNFKQSRPMDLSCKHLLTRDALRAGPTSVDRVKRLSRTHLKIYLLQSVRLTD
jgi:hypothetical protein